MTVSDGAPGSSPYRGLAPYREDDFALFFGRDAETEIIAANLRAFRLTLLYGASGVGKTSVVQAGVGHRLRRRAMQDVAEEGSPEFVPVIFNTWTGDPVPRLQNAVRESIAALVGPERVEAGPPPRGGLARTLGSWADHFDIDLLLMLDQFEEYFLYHPRAGEAFESELARLVNAPDARVNIVISIRDDALALLDRFKGDIPELFDNYLRVDPLSVEDAEAAVTGPIEKYNQMQHAPDIDIEPELVESVIDGVQGERMPISSGLGGGLPSNGAHHASTASGEIAPAYLQLVMTRLWDEEIARGSNVLRAQTLVEMGGTETILRSHVSTSMANLRRPEQRAAARAFRFLVTPSGRKVAQSGDDLAEYAGVDAATLKAVLEKLCQKDSRLLRPTAGDGGDKGPPRYEIGHDLLGPGILGWSRQHMHEESRRRMRWSLLGVIALLGCALAVVLLVAVDWRQERDAANAARVEAENQLKARPPPPSYQSLVTDTLPSHWEPEAAVAEEPVGNRTESFTRYRSGGKSPREVVGVNQVSPSRPARANALAEERRLQESKTGAYERRKLARLRIRGRPVTELQFVTTNPPHRDFAGQRERRAGFFFNLRGSSWWVIGAAKGRTKGKAFRSARRHALDVVEELIVKLNRRRN